MTDVVIHKSSQTLDISLTDRAQQHVLAYLQKESQHQGLRMSVKKTGCSGYSYVIDYVTTPEETDMVFPLLADYILCIDASSYPLLKGMQVDYVKTGLNSKFVFHNPNQTGQCGCGESFTVDL